MPATTHARRCSALVLLGLAAAKIPSEKSEINICIDDKYEPGYRRRGNAGLPAKVKHLGDAIGVSEERFGEIFRVSGYDDPNLRSEIERTATRPSMGNFKVDDPVMVLAQRVQLLKSKHGCPLVREGPNGCTEEQLAEIGVVEDELTTAMLKRVLKSYITKDKFGLGSVNLAVLGDKVCPPTQFHGPGFDCEPDPCAGIPRTPGTRDANWHVERDREMGRMDPEVLREAFDPTPHPIGEQAILSDGNVNPRDKFK